MENKRGDESGSSRSPERSGGEAGGKGVREAPLWKGTPEEEGRWMMIQADKD